MHEMPGLIPHVLRFADRVAEAGMTVFCRACSGSRANAGERGYVAATAVGCWFVAAISTWAGGPLEPGGGRLRALARKPTPSAAAGASARWHVLHRRFALP